MFRSIRWRIAATFTVLLIVCIGGLSAYLSHFFRDNYVDNLRTQLADQLSLISELCPQVVYIVIAEEMGQICAQSANANNEEHRKGCRYPPSDTAKHRYASNL